MTNVIGPISLNHWETMLCLKGSLALMHERNKDGKFDNAIVKEKDLYKHMLNKYVGSAA